MTQTRESTARSRYFGAELRRRREAANWSALHLAQKMCWAPSTVSRLESGERGVTQVNLATYLSLCGVVGDEQAELLELARAKDDAWWTCAHDELEPDELPALWFTCGMANRATCWHPGGVPELLHTEEFGVWQIRSRYGTGAAAAELWAERLERQQMLYRPVRLSLTYYLQESALRSLPRDPDVRSGQMVHLAMVVGERRVKVRVVPARFDHLLPAMGRFWLFGFTGFAPVVCAQSDLVSSFGEREHDVAAYERILTRLDALALPPDESVELVVRIGDERNSRHTLLPAS